MKKKFSRLVMFAVFLALQLTLLPLNEAKANEVPLSVTELNIKVMPEFINPDDWDYNTPSLLVGYHGSVTNKTNEPYDGEIIVPIPTNLPQFTLGYIAQEVTEDEHLQLDYKVNEEAQYISLIPPTPIAPNESFNFILEHFTASIEGVVDRNFTFEFLADTEIESFNVAFYAPFNSEDFHIDKEATLVTNSFGVKILVYEYSSVNENESFDFGVSYKKDSIVTTVEAFNDFEMPNDEAHAGFNQSTTDGNNPSFISPENAILIVLTIIIVGAFLYIILRKKNMNTAVKESAIPKRIVNKEEEIKKLRKLLADGHIDEKTYKEKRSKLG